MGLFSAIALLKRTKDDSLKFIDCGRCGLHYNVLENDACPHCNDLNEEALRQLKIQSELDYQDRKSIGITFILISFLILILLVLFLI